jgi:hypothetical protein
LDEEITTVELILFFLFILSIVTRRRGNYNGNSLGRQASPQLPGTHHQLWIFSCGFCWLAYAYEK